MTRFLSALKDGVSALNQLMTQHLPGVRPELLSGPGRRDPEPPVDGVDAVDTGDFPDDAIHQIPLSPVAAPPVVHRYWGSARSEQAALLAAMGALIIAIVVVSALIAQQHFRKNTVAVPPPITETPVTSAPLVPGVPLNTAPPGVSPTVTPPPLPPQATVPAPPQPVASPVLPPPPPVLPSPPPAAVTTPPPPPLPSQPVNTPVASPVPSSPAPVVVPAPAPAPTTNPSANNGVSLQNLQITNDGGRFAGTARILNASGHPVRSGDVQITLRNGSTVVGVLTGTIAGVADGATTTIPVSSNNAFSSGNFTAELAVANLS